MRCVPLRASCFRVCFFDVSAMNHAPAPPTGAEASNEFFNRVPSAVRHK